jgi:L-threonylcarbamoyladenylate synthase
LNHGNTMPDTEIIIVDPNHPNTQAIAHAAAIIRRGGLVAFPTETVYGLGANALDDVAVQGIFAAKRRPAHDPLIVHVADASELPRLARSIPMIAHTLTDLFWPGPLTLVLPKTDAVPDSVTAGGATVAVRCPNHPLALALIRAAGAPIAAPSANLFSHTSPTTAQHVWDDLAGRIDLILDGGPTSIGVESTVLDLSGAAPLLLRPGGVTLEALAAVLGAGVVVQRNRPPAGIPLASPGLFDRHYAPQAEMRLFTGQDVALRSAMRNAAGEELAVGQAVGLLLADDDLPFFAGLDCPVFALGPLSDLATIAQRLYDGLRALDRAGVEIILARDAPAHGLGLAICDRLRRAAQVVIEVGEPDR